MLNMYSVVSNVEWGQIDHKDNRRVKLRSYIFQKLSLLIKMQDW